VYTWSRVRRSSGCCWTGSATVEARSGVEDTSSRASWAAAALP